MKFVAKLEELSIGSQINGILPDETVKIIAVEWHGSNVIEVSFKDSKGSLSSRLLYREDEPSFSVIQRKIPYNFDMDCDSVRLISEAYRIHLAHIFDPYLAVHTSLIDPLPHQISAVYGEMLPRLPLRYVLADDPGAGKTIMTGLLLKELIARGDVKRCLIVCPGSLAQNWQSELHSKFKLNFEIVSNDRIENAVSGNIFTEIPLCIARLDKLSRNTDIQDKLKRTDWDLIVCDEAHKMSATIWGGEVTYTKRFQLGRLLSNITRHFLLLTATPHNGKEEDFQLFMSLIDADRFEAIGKTGVQAVDVSDVMRRLVKEELLKFDGKPLFPERRAYTVNYDLSDEEAVLYHDVTEYVEEEFNRADKLNNERKTTVGFALTILQRRLASSPEAIFQSLHRRTERLERRLAEERLGKRAEEIKTAFNADDFDEDDLSPEELEENERKVIDQATAASTISELEAEIETLRRLEKMANQVRRSGKDRKWDELSHLLQENEQMFDKNGKREKLIVFTEHRDTLNYLTSKIGSLLGNADAVVTIHGGMLRNEREKAEELFKQDKDVRVLIATDAAGEGINLQRAHLMVNYDLPWNPNKLEQRFGRIHRIGQTEVCHLWNLVAKETREGAVFNKLFNKLKQEELALGGKVFDVLGAITFENKPLRDLLIEAIRYGNDPKVRERLNQVVDTAMNPETFKQLLRERALTHDVMDAEAVFAIRDQMLRAEAHRLQPYFIASFFLKAFETLGGKIRECEPGRYEIISVPFAIRSRDMQIGTSQSVLRRYERICFDKKDVHLPDCPEADLICPAHPLMDAVIDLVLEKKANILKRGCTFVDENDESTQPRLLFYIEDALNDNKRLPDRTQRIISKRVHFIEIKEDGSALNAGYAPYLDYRALREDEKTVIAPFIEKQTWLSNDIEKKAVSYAVANLVPAHLNEVKSRKITQIEKTEKAVKDRLTSAIQYYDYRADELSEKEKLGKINAKLNSQKARERADELELRMKKRLADLNDEKCISSIPPVVVSANLVIPVGLIRSLSGQQITFGADKKAIELEAMQAVEIVERERGHQPQDVSKQNYGYDIESKTENGELLFIEVKGRVSSATSITVTKNEILTALNMPEQFILAIVSIDGNKKSITYLKNPFKEHPDLSVNSINYDITRLISDAFVVLEKQYD